MKLAITGHRPDKLSHTRGQYVHAIERAYFLLDSAHATDSVIDVVYIGMASGADLLAAKAAFMVQIPFIAVIPWAGHRDSISKEWLGDYDQALKYAEFVEVLSDSKTYPGSWVYHNRNKYMVDHADATMAIWNGRIDEGGGTLATVNYTRIRRKPVHVLDPKTLELEIASTEEV